MIAPLQCVSCNAPLAIVDSPSVACAFCGISNSIPHPYREELRLTRELDDATRKAALEWARLNHISFPRWWFLCAAFAPFILISIGLAVALVIGLVSAGIRSRLPMLTAAGIWLPLIPLEVIAALVGVQMILVSGAASVGSAFAAARPSAAGAPPNCRLCGAPLTVYEADILVRCIYCKADSIVYFDQSSMGHLQARLGSARSSLAEAMVALAAKTRIIKFQIRGRALVTLAFLILPLIWSFSAAMQASYWSMLIALDVWVLAMCLFWYLREAFLPAVTIEELETLINRRNDFRTGKESSNMPKPPGARGWYAHASEKRNFVLPAIVALMFLAMEILVSYR
jgi:hypothetical protein